MNRAFPLWIVLFLPGLRNPFLPRGYNIILCNLWQPPCFACIANIWSWFLFKTKVGDQFHSLPEWIYSFNTAVFRHLSQSSIRVCLDFTQFRSVTQWCLTLCDPMDSSTPGLPVNHQLPELAQPHVHWVGDTILPSHPLSSPSSAFNLSQHQGLFQCVCSSHQVAKGLEFQLQHQSFQWIFKTDFLFFFRNDQRFSVFCLPIDF